MNKLELVEAVATKTGTSKADAGRAVDAIVQSITQSLCDGDSVVILGFGTFDVRESAARTGRNPRTGEQLQIKASKRAVFKAGKALKDSVQKANGTGTK